MSKRTDLMDEPNMIQQSNERHKIAKKKRLLQLKRYSQYEKQLEKSSSRKSLTLLTRKSTAPGDAKKTRKDVKFVGKVRLLEAAARNDVEEVRQLLENGVSPDVTNDDGLTALHQCCIDNFEEMLCLLIEYHANVNACDSELWTPLHAAAACGHLILCRHLINNGSDLMAVNCDGMMSYDICDNEATLDFIETEMTKRGITQQLIDETRNLRELNMLKDMRNLTSQGYYLDWRGRSGETMLHIAACNGYMEVAQFLLSQSPAAVDAVDNELWQPVHCAVCWNQLAVLELLLAHGASLESRTRSGETPLDICEDEELKRQIIEMRDHWQKNKISKSRDLVHRHSSNVRSSSVRRSSMKQKKATSMKEALEEGRLLNISGVASPCSGATSNGGLEDETDLSGTTDSCSSAGTAGGGSKKRSSFAFKDRVKSSINRSTTDQKTSPANGTDIDLKDSRQSTAAPSFSVAENNTGRLQTALNYDSDATNAGTADDDDDDTKLLNNERLASYRSTEVTQASDGHLNNNNNVIRLGTPLPSALKKTDPQRASSTAKSDGCCCIV